MVGVRVRGLHNMQRMEQGLAVRVRGKGGVGWKGGLGLRILCCGFVRGSPPLQVLGAESLAVGSCSGSE